MRSFLGVPFLLSLLAVLGACSNDAPPQSPASQAEMAAEDDGAEREAIFNAPSTQSVDRFTYSNYKDVAIYHVSLDIDVDFDNKVIAGSVILDLKYENEDADELILDTDELDIKSVYVGDGTNWEEVPFEIGAHYELLGAPLTLPLADRPNKVKIDYATSPTAQGIMWLSPEQTSGKEKPFMFTQFQTIYARTFAPLQDTPAVRITYDAHVTTPEGLVAVMGAVQDPDDERDGDYTFTMPQPIPSYLMAIAIGDIEFKAINDHVGVYAERDFLDAAVAEFEDTPLMEEAIISLYGPYLWGRYDMIVLPPSFPFGGMENPRLSFLTPTLIAGDKSLTNVVAHELAHSWSGNLVTNAVWEDAWLNEGFTSYVENRVMEELYGVDRAAMEQSLDLENLKETVASAARPELTALRMPNDMEEPYQAFSQMSYAGGMFFLRFLEQRFGREVFDEFIRDYFEHFAFQSIVTEDFLAFFEDRLWSKYPDAVTRDELNAWIFEPGLPDTLVEPVSTAFDKVSASLELWLDGDISLADIDTAAWTTHEWLHFLNEIPETVSVEQLTELDSAFGLSENSNAEIAFAWYVRSVKSGYEAADAGLEAFLLSVGRGKFIYPLYRTLIENDRAEWARDIYDRARPGYHPIAQSTIDQIFAVTAKEKD